MPLHYIFCGHSSGSVHIWLDSQVVGEPSKQTIGSNSEDPSYYSVKEKGQGKKSKKQRQRSA